MTPRVAVGPADVAGCSTALAAVLRREGVDVDAGLWAANPVGYGQARVLSRDERIVYALRLPFRRDVIQYEYGSTWLRFADAYWARLFRRTLVARYHGDDCRLYGEARRLFPARGRTGDPAQDLRVLRRLRRLSRVCSAAIAADLELATYLAPIFRRVYVAPLPVVLPDAGFERRSNDPPVVLHATTDPRFKGTDAIAAAAEAVARRTPLDFRLRIGVPHSQLMREVAAADVVIDQLDSVTAGVFALEAMWLGAAVLGEIDRRALPPYQSELPIVEVTRETLEAELESLVRDEPRRKRLAATGREYVGRTYAPERLARAHLAIYGHARTAPRGVYEAAGETIEPLALEQMRAAPDGGLTSAA